MVLMNNHKFFSNKDCKYYPCHNLKDINCLFCYCPLYHLDCGGNFTTLPNDIKDCSNCTIPHGLNSHQYVVNKLKEYYDM